MKRQPRARFGADFNGRNAPPEVNWASARRSERLDSRNDATGRLQSATCRSSKEEPARRITTCARTSSSPICASNTVKPGWVAADTRAEINRWIADLKALLS